jgi:type III restriction enzyme
MKFNFKIQPFQTEAVENIVRMFGGQPKQNRIAYRRDVDKYEKPAEYQMTIFTPEAEDKDEHFMDRAIAQCSPYRLE